MGVHDHPFFDSFFVSLQIERGPQGRRYAPYGEDLLGRAPMADGNLSALPLFVVYGCPVTSPSPLPRGGRSHFRETAAG